MGGRISKFFFGDFRMDDVDLSDVQMPGESSDPNVLFYRNQVASRATFGEGARIDAMHATWDGNYYLLETEHGYIQWIFPLFEGAGSTRGRL